MKPIHVAFSGSGTKAPAHLGALFALHEGGWCPVQVAGSSGGSMIAGLYACGMEVSDMVDLVMSMSWSPLMAWSPAAIFSGAFSNGNNLHRWLQKGTKGLRFKDLKTDLIVVASDIYKIKPVRFCKDATPDVAVALACRASASIPFFFSPVKYKGSRLVDSGLTNNIPVDLLTVTAAPRIGIQLVSNVPTLKNSDSLNVFSMAERCFDLLFSGCENAHVSAAERNGAHMVYVETGYAGSLDKNMSVETKWRLFWDGYSETKQVLAAMEAPK